MQILLNIDVETFCELDLKRVGVYVYTEHPSFRVLLFGYAFSKEPVTVVDLEQGEKISQRVMDALFNPDVIKSAFNANFERTCLARHFKKEMPPQQWRCTQVQASMLALPHTLEGVGEVLKLPVQKERAGTRLINYFSKLNKGKRNLPIDNPEKWECFKDYCRQDVEVERAVQKRLERYPVPPFEQKMWQLDQKINDTGVMVDKEMLKQALRFDELNQEQLLERAKRLTGLPNPNSVTQLKKWLEINGEEVKSLDKEAVETLVAKTTGIVKAVLQIRQELAKTSIKKYQAVHRALCSDNRVRGLFKFYGANRTGRFSSKIVQLQNLPRNHIQDLDSARQSLKKGDFQHLDNSILSQLTRTLFISAKKFIVSDFSSIEARIISWLANENWRLNVFRSHGKIYEASASEMFGVPLEAITKELRQRGKIAELALGYGGGVNALIQMGALDMGISEDELPVLVNTWRNANPNIVKLWRIVESAALLAVEERRTVRLPRLKFSYQSNILFIELPSGRKLSYVNPKIKLNKYGKNELIYEGLELGRWTTIKTWGGKLVENVTQAIARDCLAVAMLRLDGLGYSICMHIHDEIVIDGDGSVRDVEQIMSEPISWAEGLPLAAEGFESDYYKKE